MLKSMAFVVALFAATSVGAAEPGMTFEEPPIYEESFDNIEYDAEDYCSRYDCPPPPPPKKKIE